jgi:hypothetical protein
MARGQRARPQFRLPLAARKLSTIDTYQAGIEGYFARSRSSQTVYERHIPSQPTVYERHMVCLRATHTVPFFSCLLLLVMSL